MDIYTLVADILRDQDPIPNKESYAEQALSETWKSYEIINADLLIVPYMKEWHPETFPHIFVAKLVTGKAFEHILSLSNAAFSYDRAGQYAHLVRDHRGSYANNDEIILEAIALKENAGNLFIDGLCEPKKGWLQVCRIRSAAFCFDKAGIWARQYFNDIPKGVEYLSQAAAYFAQSGDIKRAHESSRRIVCLTEEHNLSGFTGDLDVLCQRYPINGLTHDSLSFHQ